MDQRVPNEYQVPNADKFCPQLSKKSQFLKIKYHLTFENPILGVGVSCLLKTETEIRTTNEKRSLINNDKTINININLT